MAADTRDDLMEAYADFPDEEPVPVTLPQAIVRQLDEAMRVVELRRYHRILLGARLPVVYAVAVFMLAGLFAPFFLGGERMMGGQRGLLSFPGSGAGVLLLISAAAGALAAYLRAMHLWNQERDHRTLEILLLTRQQPARVAATAVLMSALLGLAMVALP
ncbi:MAG: hypothetical protein ACO1SX_09565, partial [Actinomycetota bacterium]